MFVCALQYMALSVQCNYYIKQYFKAFPQESLSKLTFSAFWFQALPCAQRSAEKAHSLLFL